MGTGKGSLKCEIGFDRFGNGQVNEQTDAWKEAETVLKSEGNLSGHVSF